MIRKVRDEGVVPDLEPDSPRELKEWSIHARKPIGRYRDVDL